MFSKERIWQETENNSTNRQVWELIWQTPDKSEQHKGSKLCARYKEQKSNLVQGVQLSLIGVLQIVEEKGRQIFDTEKLKLLKAKSLTE